MSKSTTERQIETQVWVPDGDRPGYSKLVRTKTIREVFDELSAYLGEYPVGAEEYFGLGLPLDTAREWPVDARVVCFAVEGSSEGDYVHVEALHPDGTYENLMLGKTFTGWDDAWAFAKRLGEILDVY